MILGILQARVASTRLPKKVLKEILGEPMLWRQIERLQRSKTLDTLVVATSLDPSDDEIEVLCRKRGVLCRRGSLEDVLDRFYQVVREFQPHHIVRLTGDCPLCDPSLMDQVVQFHLEGKYDYTTNTWELTYPDGLDVEVVCAPAFERAYQEAKLKSEREHVTSFIYSHPERFRIGNFKGSTDLSRHRWTVDEAADFEFVKRVYEKLYPENPQFSCHDILKLLKVHPEWVHLNAHIKRDEGYEISLQNDKEKSHE